MASIICSPGTYIQGKGELKNLCVYYRQIGSRKAYMIVDGFIDNTYHDKLADSFEKAGQPYEIAVFGGECSKSEIKKHQDRLGDSDVVFGIGGGKTLDAAKAVAHYSGLPVIIIPTAASTDAPCSRLSVLYTDTHEFDQYLPLPSPGSH